MTEPDTALLVTNNNKCSKSEATPTLNNLSNTIDMNQPVNEF
jgi:hypothetical protein